MTTTIKSLEDSFKGIDDDIDDGGVLLISSRPKVGKTTWASTILTHLDPNRLAYYVLEPQATKAIWHNPECLAYLEKMNVPELPPQRTVRCRTYDEFESNLYSQVINPALDVGDANDPGMVKFAVVDSGTKLSRFLKKKYKPYPERGKDARQQWMSILKVWENLCDDAAQAGIWLIFIVHLRDEARRALTKPGDKEGVSERDEETKLLPYIDGSGREVLMQECMHDLHVTRESGSSDFRIYSREKDDVFAGGRLDIPADVVNPTLGEVLYFSGVIRDMDLPPDWEWQPPRGRKMPESWAAKEQPKWKKGRGKSSSKKPTRKAAAKKPAARSRA